MDYEKLLSRYQYAELRREKMVRKSRKRESCRSVPFLLVGALFFFNTFVALKQLEFLKIDLPFVNKQFGFFSAIGILVISVVGGLAFEVIMAGSGAINWWLSTGFYAGLIGGVLITLLYYLESKTPQISV